MHGLQMKSLVCLVLTIWEITFKQIFTFQCDRVIEQNTDESRKYEATEIYSGIAIPPSLLVSPNIRPGCVDYARIIFSTIGVLIEHAQQCQHNLEPTNRIEPHRIKIHLCRSYSVKYTHPTAIQLFNNIRNPQRKLLQLLHIRLQTPLKIIIIILFNAFIPLHGICT